MDDMMVYTKEDFLEGLAPFEEVYKSKEDEFELGRAIEKMANIAKTVGVSNFKAMFKDYCRKVENSIINISDENLTRFDGQEKELKTGKWVADDDGIRKDSQFGEIVACVHPILPVTRMINVDSGIEKLKITFRKGGAWRSMVCDRKDLATANSIVGLANYGVAVTSENARDLVQYIHDVENLNYGDIEEFKSVSRLGWINKVGFSPYVDKLIFDGDMSFKHFYESVKASGSFEKWKNICVKVRKADSVPARIALAAGFASILVEPCRSLPFFVHLWGGSETGKTVAIMLAASIWANPRMGSYVHTFNSTAVAQELSAGFVNSLPLIIDELQMIKDKKNFDQMIYQLSEGVGRVRGQKQGGLQKTNSWSNCIISTGEQPLTGMASGGGAINRVVEIDCKEKTLFNPTLIDRGAKGVLDVIYNNYGHAGKVFVEAITQNGVMEEIKELHKNLQIKLQKYATEKQANAAALILAADTFADLFIFKDNNALTIDDIKHFLVDKDEMSQNVRAYEWLRGWLAQNSNKFVEDNADQHEVWGKTSVGGTCIIGTVFSKACIDSGFNPTAFLGWLKEKNFIDTCIDKKNQKLVKINKKPVRCVVLKDNADQAVMDGFVEITGVDGGF